MAVPVPLYICGNLVCELFPFHATKLGICCCEVVHRRRFGGQSFRVLSYTPLKKLLDLVILLLECSIPAPSRAEHFDHYRMIVLNLSFFPGCAKVGGKVVAVCL